MTSSSLLYQKINHKPQIPYVVNNFIYEYDLSKANISVLFTEGVIDEKTYRDLYQADRNRRQITVGLMIRKDPALYKVISDGVIKAKKRLFEANEIMDHEVLSIKNDAVFVIGRKLKQTDFGLLSFKCKNVYTIFFQLLDLEVYYYDYHTDNGLEVNIDIKGINDEVLPLHENGMLQVICDVCNRLQRGSIVDTLSYMIRLYESYINRALPIDYYREFNADSRFLLRSRFRMDYLNTIKPEYLKDIDINRNRMILQSLVQIVSTIYQSIIK